MESMTVLSLLGIPLLLQNVLSLDNGLARTPPMGWMHWERFRCNVACDTDPDNCISEKLFVSMAEALVKTGLNKVGYEYIIIDDCWLDHQRDAQGRLQPDAKRFPSGMKALADRIHGMGLKFGMYEDYGNYTCGGYPGILGHLELDAHTFASWEIDYLKVDGCYADTHDMDEGYPAFGRYLNATGRPIVYSCSWPDYQLAEGKQPDYGRIAEHCNLWRNFDDIDDSWESVLSIIDFYGNSNTSDDFASFAGPGHWNDPDMLIIGNFGLSYDQAQVQMAVWCVLAAPLIMSNDLRHLKPEFLDILSNPLAIKVNQDPLGVQGRMVYSKNHVNIFRKPVLPTSNGARSQALAIVYRGTYGTPVKVTFTPEQLGISEVGAQDFEVIDIFSKEKLGIIQPTEPFSLMVNPTGVRFLRLNVNPKGRLPVLNPVQQAPTLPLEEVEITNPGLSGWKGADEL